MVNKKYLKGLFRVRFDGLLLTLDGVERGGRFGPLRRLGLFDLEVRVGDEADEDRANREVLLARDGLFEDDGAEDDRRDEFHVSDDVIPEKWLLV
jgi:hypothetical protein